MESGIDMYIDRLNGILENLNRVLGVQILKESVFIKEK
jgi:hypothetical protein